MLIQPYLIFNGRTDEALAFYKKAIGAEVQMLMRFKDSPDPNMCAPGSLEKVMHSCFKVGETSIMASDGRGDTTTQFQNFALTITVKNEAEADKTFAALAEGGQITMPLAKTFFAPKFGMLADRFGVAWMVIVQP